MDIEHGDSVWAKKGATLSDASAQKEFGLTRHEIIEAIQCGKLQYRENNIYGSPYLRLIRCEVEALVNEKYGGNYLEKKKLKKELAEANKTLKTLKVRATALEKRKAEILKLLGE